MPFQILFYHILHKKANNKKTPKRKFSRIFFFGVKIYLDTNIIIKASTITKIVTKAIFKITEKIVATILKIILNRINSVIKTVKQTIIITIRSKILNSVFIVVTSLKLLMS